MTDPPPPPFKLKNLRRSNSTAGPPLQAPLEDSMGVGKTVIYFIEKIKRKPLTVEQSFL